MFKARAALFVLLAVALIAAGYFAQRGFDILGLPRETDVRPVHQGHQEIAWIGPATGTDSWERFVAAVRLLKEQGLEPQPGSPRIHAFLDRVFRERTTDVPELALWLEGGEHAKLWIRWYKVSSEIDAATWIAKLAQRNPPPLAILGGETSDRALNMAEILAGHRSKWHGTDPLFLITTATADLDSRRETPNQEPLTPPLTPRLMHVYNQRSFRFSFTNSRMAEVVIAFVKDHPEVWSHSRHALVTPPLVVGANNPLAAVGLLASEDHWAPVSLYTLAWGDDPYSKDLAARFNALFPLQYKVLSQLPGEPGSELEAADPFKVPARIVMQTIPYGVGGYDSPNPAEVYVVERFLEERPMRLGQRQLLALPTETRRARRFVRTLARRAPLDVSNLVVLSGDAITFNHMYRDRDVAWNILDVPVPLVFFSHRNPISDAAGFRPRSSDKAPAATTGTQDLLLQRDVVEAVLQAAYRTPVALVGADELRDRLRRLCWDKGRVRFGEGHAFFDEDGNRKDGTGEHVVWVHPVREGGHLQPEARVRVYRLRGGGPPGVRDWFLVGEPLKVWYDWRPLEARDEQGPAVKAPVPMP